VVLFRRQLLGPVALLTLAAACQQASEADSGGDDDALPDPSDSCTRDEDCLPAGASCCDCPTFALHVDSGWADACEDVACEPSMACPEVEAVCDQGVCALRCQVVECSQVCEGGFRGDELGCLTCECNDAPAAPDCAIDADCVRVPADCCGCARGGEDTAVPADEAPNYGEALECEDDPACPGVDVCEAGLVPACLAGTCELVAAGVGEPPPGMDAGTDDPGPTDGAECGTPDRPPCPEGQVCVLNDPEADDATDHRVGVCRPAE
jgi:hypothetical protein